MAGDTQEWTWRQIAQHDFRRRQLVDVVYRRARKHFAAKRRQILYERRRDRLRPAARNRPSIDVAQRRQREPDSAAQRVVERQHAVRCAAGDERARRLVLERRHRESLDGPQRMQAKPGERDRMTRNGGWTEDRSRQAWPVADDASDELRVRFAVAPECRGRRLERTHRRRHASVVERVGQHYRRFDPFEPVF